MLALEAGKGFTDMADIRRGVVLHLPGACAVHLRGHDMPEVAKEVPSIRKSVMMHADLYHKSAFTF